ncbi:tyrosine-type recombinase/integrase [Bradyrhizobium elkanii]|uniref:tyrosine-type recombinase/integrase n=1 Tax=Bradyrhizobium elkanii TaxID=29448 RepID=UPI00351650F3
MATYQKRGRTWRAIVRKKTHEATTTETKTFDTKADAIKWATALEAKIAEGQTVEHAREAAKAEVSAPAAAVLMTRYGEEVSPTKRGTRWEQIRLRMLVRRFPLFQRPAISITGPDMADWRDQRLTEVGPATVRRELGLVSAVFKIAIKEWRLGLTVNPCRLITWPKKPRARTQRVPDEVKQQLIAHLGWDGVSRPTNSNQWAALVLAFALETAMRKGEILSLQWCDIFFGEKYAHLDMTKNGEERDVPLSKAAIALLKIAGPGKPEDRVFKVTSGHLDKIMREARIDLDLMHVRFHDARREATTNIAAKMANVLELSAITGHKTLDMLKVYYRPKASDLADKLDA